MLTSEIGQRAPFESGVDRLQNSGAVTPTPHSFMGGFHCRVSPPQRDESITQVYPVQLRQFRLSMQEDKSWKKNSNNDCLSSTLDDDQMPMEIGSSSQLSSSSRPHLAKPQSCSSRHCIDECLLTIHWETVQEIGAAGYIYHEAGFSMRWQGRGWDKLSPQTDGSHCRTQEITRWAGP